MSAPARTDGAGAPAPVVAPADPAAGPAGGSVLGALLYLTGASLGNRVRTQLRRLRQPRALLALAAGVAYVWWFLLRPAHEGGAAAVLDGAWPPRLAALALTALAAKWWLAGADERALTFTPAESSLLFPAPVSRRGLVHWKLWRAQLVILLNTVLWTVLLRGEGTELSAWRRALAVWVLLSAVTLHRLGAALFTESRRAAWEAAPDRNARWRHGLARALPVAAVALVLAMLVAPVVRAAPTLATAWDAGPRTFVRVLGLLLDDGAPAAVLAPARALVAPLFAGDAAGWVRALGPAVGLLALHYLWVLRSDAAVQELALDVAERRARRRAAAADVGVEAPGGGAWATGETAAVDLAGSGAPPGPGAAGGPGWRTTGGQAALTPRPSGAMAAVAQVRRRHRLTPPLAPVGNPAVAIVWKNAVAALRATALVRVLALYALLAGGALALALRDPRLAELASVVIAVWAVMLLVAGPLWVRFDLRHDLPHLPLLRSYPLRGRDIVAAEVTASALALTLAQLAMLGLLLLATGGTRGGAGLPPADRHALAAAAALALPGVNLATLTLQNAAALLFPAWVRPPGAPRGLEAMGQNLVTTALTLAGAAVLLALPAGLAALLYRALDPWLGAWALAPAALLASAAVALELVPVLAALGRVFERTDPSAVPSA